MSEDRTLELGLKLPAPEVSPQQIERLVDVLVAGPDEKENWAGWMTAAEIARKMDGAPERKVRKIANAAAPAVVSFPGSPGYKVWALCTVDEINHAIEAMEAQARDMIKRANLYRRAYHRRFRGSS